MAITAYQHCLYCGRLSRISTGAQTEEGVCFAGAEAVGS